MCKDDEDSNGDDDDDDDDNFTGEIEIDCAFDCVVTTLSTFSTSLLS
jgi:hypothetical protein